MFHGLRLGEREMASRRRGRCLTSGVGAAASVLLGLALLAASARASETDSAQAAADYASVPWGVLADWTYEDPGIGGLDDASEEALAKRHEQLPPDVRALDGKLVSVRGFAVPAEVDDGRISSLMLLANNELDCPYGHYPSMNEWIMVRVRPVRVDLRPYEPMRVSGRLEVGEEVEGGTVLSLYRLKADRVEPGR